jgi:hypothetical protein
MLGPTLIGRSVTLGPLAPEHLDNYCRWFADPEVTRYVYRIAQTVAAMYLEPNVEPIFHEDSYRYRPGRSALQALERRRARCWQSDWVIDLDIKNFVEA